MKGGLFSWTTSDGSIVSGANTTTAIVSAAGTYVLRVTNPVTGCFVEQSVVVTESITLPDASITPPSEITCASPTVNLVGTSTTQGVSYLWSTVNGVINSGANTTTAVVSAAGVYTLTVTIDATGCSTSTNVTVTAAMDLPDVSIATPDQITCDVTTVTLNASSTTANVTYQWSTTDGVIDSGANTTAPTVSASGTYTVVVTNTATGVYF